MGKLADKWEKDCFKRCGAGWRNDISLVSMWHKLARQDKLNEEAKEREKERKEELREQTILILKAKIQEVASKQPLTIDEIESELLDLITRETGDISTRFKELARIEFLLKDYHGKILDLELKESKLPSFEKKIEELAQSGAVESDFKSVLDARARELAKTFKSLKTALKVIKSKREVSE